MAFFKRIPYGGVPMNGIVSHIQKYTGVLDVVDALYFKLIVPSTRAANLSTKFVLGIDNERYVKYWSTVNNEPNMFISFQMKYPVILEGIGIATGRIDWFPHYIISTSIDLIQWHNQTINVQQPYQNQHLFFDLSFKTQCRFINITPSGTPPDSNNFALYGVDFFGWLVNPNPTCLKKSTQFFPKLLFLLVSIKN